MLRPKTRIPNLFHFYILCPTQENICLLLPETHTESNISPDFCSSLPGLIHLYLSARLFQYLPKHSHCAWVSAYILFSTHHQNNPLNFFTLKLSHCSVENPTNLPFSLGVKVKYFSMAGKALTAIITLIFIILYSPSLTPNFALRCSALSVLPCGLISNGSKCPSY